MATYPPPVIRSNAVFSPPDWNVASSSSATTTTSLVNAPNNSVLYNSAGTIDGSSLLSFSNGVLQASQISCLTSLNVQNDVLSVGDRVGINTADPQYDLDVRGDLSISGQLLVDGSPLSVNVEVDATPTQNSPNPISSGGVFTALQSKVEVSVYDAFADNFGDRVAIAESDIITLNNNLNGKANIDDPTFTGTVSGITKAMVGLGNVDNTSDANKPVSTATQSALSLKANIDNPTFTGTVSGITKAMVGLDRVDNTADANKPISTATQTALNTKQDLLTTNSDISIRSVQLTNGNLNVNGGIPSTVFLTHLDSNYPSDVGYYGLGSAFDFAGQPALVASQKKFGTASINLSSGSYRWSNTNNVISVGSQAFTFEGWVYLLSVPSSTGALFGLYAPLPTPDNLAVAIRSEGGNLRLRLRFNSFTDQEILTNITANSVLNTWIHVAVSCSGVNQPVRGFINGVAGNNTLTYSTSLPTPSQVILGISSMAGSVNAYLDEVRLTVGSNLYTSSFTPPTSAFPDGLPSSILTVNASNKRVGILNQSPNFTLDVMGDINSTGTISCPNVRVSNGNVQITDGTNTLTLTPTQISSSSSLTVGSGSVNANTVALTTSPTSTAFRYIPMSTTASGNGTLSTVSDFYYITSTKMLSVDGINCSKTASAYWMMFNDYAVGTRNAFARIHAYKASWSNAGSGATATVNFGRNIPNACIVATPISPQNKWWTCFVVSTGSTSCVIGIADVNGASVGNAEANVLVFENGGSF